MQPPYLATELWLLLWLTLECFKRKFVWNRLNGLVGLVFCLKNDWNGCGFAPNGVWLLKISHAKIYQKSPSRNPGSATVYIGLWTLIPTFYSQGGGGGLYARPGAYEPLKAAKEHATTWVPLKYKFKCNTFQIWKMCVYWKWLLPYTYMDSHTQFCTWICIWWHASYTLLHRL